MNAFSSYLIGIVAVVVLSILIDLILPDSKISKYVKSVMAIFVIAVILSPVKNLLNTPIDWKNEFLSSPYVIDTAVLENLNMQNLEFLSKATEEKLKSEGYQNINIDITSDSTKNKISCVYVDLTNLVIKGEANLVDYTTQIKNLISLTLGVDKEVIILYG